MKLKTSKSASKRVNIKKGIFYRKKAYKSHLLKHKSSKRLRHLSQVTIIHKTDFSNYSLMLPYH